MVIFFYCDANVEMRKEGKKNNIRKVEEGLEIGDVAEDDKEKQWNNVDCQPGQYGDPGGVEERGDIFTIVII